jgi:CheY-like chemotaxis protein
VPVLIVDDNATARTQLAGTLARYGMKPVAVENGAQAIAALEEADRAGSPLRLALVDAHMPDTEGLRLVEKIRRKPAGKDLRIVMLASQTRRPGAARCRELDIDDCLLKPIGPASLAGALSQVLSGAAPMRKGTPAVHPAAQLGLRVLVAEDNPVNQQVALLLLRKRGCSVALASDGKQALAAIERESFDVVLMDLQMPEMDGLEATAAIRAREAASGGHLPIIALTAHAQSGDRDKCLSAGMDGYISKPIQPHELAEAIEKATKRDAVLLS